MGEEGCVMGVLVEMWRYWGGGGVGQCYLIKGWWTMVCYIPACGCGQYVHLQTLPTLGGCVAFIDCCHGMPIVCFSVHSQWVNHLKGKYQLSTVVSFDIHNVQRGLIMVQRGLIMVQRGLFINGPEGFINSPGELLMVQGELLMVQGDLPPPPGSAKRNSPMSLHFHRFFILQADP